MDMSLRELVHACDEIHRKIDSVNPSSFYINDVEVKKDMSKLIDIYEKIRSINLKVANIYNICNNKCKTITHDYNTKTKKIASWGESNKKLTTGDVLTNKPLTDDISVNVKVVNDISEVPNIPLYWVSNINQYAIHVNGIMFRGNIGNIYNKTTIRAGMPTNQTIICNRGNNCRNILNGSGCSFYHDQQELLQLHVNGRISGEFFEICKKKYRNFFNTSWICTEMSRNKKNKSMRHFGSRNMLKYELDIMKISDSKSVEISFNNFRQQCMHDILIVIALNQCNALKEHNVHG